MALQNNISLHGNSFIRVALFVAALILMTSVSNAADRPNILIISIDDLNDWTGCLGGHPQAKTPNIDRLAKRGTLFRNAHCQAPICTPSRASMLTGLYPTTTGLYFLQPALEASKVAMKRPHLLRHFAKAGYHTMGAGKFVHGGNDRRHYQEYGGGMGGFGPAPDKKISYPMGHKLWDWGPFPEDESKMPDTKVADWVIERLNKKQDQPFLLVAGFWRPHVPLFAPPRWFEKFPLNKVQLPKTLANDRDDLSDYAKRLTIGLPAPRHEWFVENDAWRGAVRAYLASVAFADYCAGRVLDADHHRGQQAFVDAWRGEEIGRADLAQVLEHRFRAFRATDAKPGGIGLGDGKNIVADPRHRQVGQHVFVFA